jgi:plasmid stabilization system protein ParE
MSERLDALRILSRYRRMVLLGRAKLPLDAARRLVGPDCAYHLYFRHAASRAVRARRRHGRRD